MKAKRFLAMLLCMTMIFGDASLVRAAEATADVAIENETIAEDAVQVDEVSEIEEITEVIEESVEETKAEESKTAVNNSTSGKNDKGTSEDGEAVIEEIVEVIDEVDSTEELAPTKATAPTPTETEDESETDKVEEEPVVAPSWTQTFFKVDGAGLLSKVSANDVPTSNIIIPKQIGGEEVKGIAPNAFEGDSVVEVVKFETGFKMNSSDLGTGIGTKAFANCSRLREVILPEPVKVGDVTYQVTAIEPYTFKNSTIEKLQYNGCKVEYIGEEAFKNSKLAYFKAEDTVRYIGESAFADCSLMTDANLRGVVRIEDEAFSGCSKLANSGGTVEFNYSLKYIGSRAFKATGIKILDMSEATGLDDVGCLGEAIFEDCKSLTTVVTPDYIPEIPTRMFFGCDKLTTVSLGCSDMIGLGMRPNTIGKEAFGDCISLYEITIPFTVSEIKTRAFTGCKKITVVDIDYYYDDIIIAKDAFPARGSELTLRGYTDAVKYYASERGFKFKDKTPKSEIKLDYDDACGKVTLSNSKPKYGETVTITISPKSGKTLHADGGKFINAEELEGTKFVGIPKFDFALDSCSRDSGTKLDKIVFKFVMRPLKNDTNTLKLKFYLDDEAKFNNKEGKAQIRTSISDPKEYKFIDGNPAYLTFNETGNNTYIQFHDADGRPIGPWRFNFKVSDDSKDIVRVTPEGLVTARYETGKEGSIIATLYSNSNQYPIHVTVLEKVTVTNMWFWPDYTPGTYPNKLKVTDSYEISETVVYNEGKENEYTKVETKEYQLITIPRSSIKKAGGSFKVQGVANLRDGGKYSIVDTNWKSGAEAIAKVEKSTSLDGWNKINIPKNANGETVITVTATNYEYKEGDPKRTFVGGFVVRVVDDTPRLVSSIITINASGDKGTKLPLIVLKEFPVDNNILYFSATKNLDKKTNYEDLEIEYNFEENAYYAKASATLINKLGKNKVVNLKNLYIRGEVNSEPFAIPVGTVYVQRKTLAPAFSVTGSINLFYKTTDGMDPDRKYSGSVYINQSLQNETVERYVLLTADNYKKVKAREATVDDFGDKTMKYYDELQNNFNISIYDTEMGMAKITRTGNTLEKNKKNKVITSGYVGVFYKGHKDPIFKKITIPTETTAPNLVLNTKVKTAHASQSKELYQLMLFDADTLTLPKLEERNKFDEKIYYYDDVLSDAEVTFDMSNSGKGTTRGLFEEPTISEVKDVEFKDPNDSKKTVKISVNKINLQLKGTAYAGRAVLNIKRANWEEPVKLTFRLKVSTKDAKAVLDPKKVTLNVAGGNTKGDVNVTFNQDFAKFVQPDSIDDIIEYVGSSKLAYDAGKIKDSMSFSISSNDAGEVAKKATLSISISGNSVSKGTYKFALAPLATYTGDSSKNLKPVKFTVTVTDKAPQIKLKASTFTLNGKYPGSEQVQQSFNIKNMPKGDYALDFSEAEIIAKSKPRDNTNDVYYMDTIVEQISANFIPKVDNEIEKKPAYMSLGFAKGTEAFPENCSYKFTVKGVKAVKDGQDTPLKDFVITIKVNVKEPKVTQTKKGVINPIDPLSDIVYTGKVSRINGKIVSVNCIELDKYNNQISAEDNHFNAELITQEDYDDEDTGLRDMYNIKLKKKKVVDNQVLVTWKKTNAIEKDKKYKINLVYYLDIEGVPAIYSTDLTIKPKQTLPQLLTTLIKPAFDTASLLPTADLTGDKLEKAENKEATLKAQKAMTATLYPGMNGNDEAITRVIPNGVKKAKVSRVWLRKNTPRELRRAFDVIYYRVDPNKDDSSLYYVKDISGNSIEVKFGTDGQVISANKIYIDPEADDFTAKAIELAKAERVYRASFRKDKNYLKGDDHYYVVVKLLNPGLVPANKQFSLSVETQYENMYTDTNGARFKLDIVVKK